MKTDSCNICIVYIVLNNFFRSCSYERLEDTPNNWKRYKQMPSIMRNLKYACMWSVCQKCKFYTTLGNVERCSVRYITHPLTKRY